MSSKICRQHFVLLLYHRPKNNVPKLFSTILSVTPEKAPSSEYILNNLYVRACSHYPSWEIYTDSFGICIMDITQMLSKLWISHSIFIYSLNCCLLNLLSDMFFYTLGIEEWAMFLILKALKLESKSMDKQES